MLLFRYFGSHAFETLRDNLLKTAAVATLNDPFELLYQLTGVMTPAKAKRYFKRRIKSDDFFHLAQQHNPAIKSKKDLKQFAGANQDKLIGNLVSSYSRLKAEGFVEKMAERSMRVICFSDCTVESLDEILIWSHYANKHTGIRIGFEFPEGIKYPFKVIPIDYRKERVALNLSEGADSIQVQNAMLETIKVKSIAWKYECEHRLITVPDFCELKLVQNNEPAHFFRFKRDWVKFVDFGVRTSTKEIQIMKEFLQKEYPSVQLRKAVFHSTDYALKYQAV